MTYHFKVSTLEDIHTPEQLANLKKLGDYLVSLPIDYLHFGMETFFYDPTQSTDYFGWSLKPPEDDSAEMQNSLMLTGKEIPCGTIACAIGHGPAAGIAFTKDDVFWSDYSERVFGLEADGEAHEWLFGGWWHDIDNTAQGAGQRILDYLKNGLPENAEEIMNNR